MGGVFRRFISYVSAAGSRPRYSAQNVRPMSEMGSGRDHRPRPIYPGSLKADIRQVGRDDRRTSVHLCSPGFTWGSIMP